MKNKKLKKHEIFKQLCFSDNTESLYREFIESKILDNQEFESLDSGRVIHNLFNPSTECRHCKEVVSEEEFEYIASYWTPNKWFIVHKECKKDARREEAYECQKIDSSCNDCIFFERVEGNKGNCKKKKVEVIAVSNFCNPDNLDCFKHRLD